MFNYDIPWSLITLEQRNGRIDRYGQKKTPYIYYVVGKTDDEAIRTDLHIINNLTKKEEEKHKTLGDLGSIMQLYNAKEEENKVIEAIEKQDEDFLEEIESFDYGASIFEDKETTNAIITENPLEKEISIFDNDFNYYKSLFNQLSSESLIKDSDYELNDQDEYLELNNTKELNKILYDLPPESKPDVNDVFKLTIDKDKVQEAIEDARKKKGDWAEFQILYDLHPAIKYYMTKLEASVPKSEALAAKLSTKLPKKTSWYVLQGQVSNNLGQPVISDFFVVGVSNDEVINSFSINDFIDKYNLDENLYTEEVNQNDLEVLHKNLNVAISYASNTHMRKLQQVLSTTMFNKAVEFEEHLIKWRAASIQQLEIKFENIEHTPRAKGKKEKQLSEINTIADGSSQYMKNMLALDQGAYIKVMAVFFNN